MDNKMMVIPEDIKSLVKANIEGQKVFEERFETRLTNIENEMSEQKVLLYNSMKFHRKPLNQSARFGQESLI